MPRFDKKNELLIRVYLTLLGFFIFAVVIGWRIVNISLVEGEVWRAKKEKRYMEWHPVKTQRGNIFADDGQSLMATSVEFFEIRMDPVAPRKEDFDKNVKGLCESLSRFSNAKTAWEWKSMIQGARMAYEQRKKGGSRNLLIARQVDHYDLQKIKKMPLFNLGKNKGGLIVRKKYVREKPYKDLAARMIGINRTENAVGLEHSFDKLLRGEEKKEYMKFIPPDLWISVFDPTGYEIIKGKDIVTTIDVRMQDIVHNELAKGLVQHNAEKGTAIVMEVSTGRIKAMTNLSWNKKGQLGEFYNYAVKELGEPGSTFKAASVLALLEDGFATSQTPVNFNLGKRKFYDQWMYDSWSHQISKSTLKEAFELSSNVGIAGIINDSYNQKGRKKLFIDKLRQFGLANKSGIEIDGEPKPFIKDPEINKDKWWGTTLPWMSFGYELSITPLQMLNFYNAIANNGKLMKPQLVKEIRLNDKIVKRIHPIVQVNKIAKEEHIRELQLMLEGVVIRGTGRNLRSPNYDFAGKTGTTKVNYAKEKHHYNASFVGYWPAKNPKYSMIVVLFGLRGQTYYGNKVAGPVFRRIMDWCFAIQDMGEIALQDEKGGQGLYGGQVYGFGHDFQTIFKDVNVRYNNGGRWVKGAGMENGRLVQTGKARISTHIIPDVSGMGLRDAVYVLENLGMKVKVDGYGKISGQSLNPGKPIENQEITLYLN